MWRMPGKNTAITLDLLSRYLRCCLSRSDDKLKPKGWLRNFSKKKGKISRGQHLRKYSDEKIMGNLENWKEFSLKKYQASTIGEHIFQALNVFQPLLISPINVLNDTMKGYNCCLRFAAEEMEESGGRITPVVRLLEVTCSISNVRKICLTAREREWIRGV